MFQKGDVLQNKHYNNLIVRVLSPNQAVSPEGSIQCAPHPDHWEKTSYWRWFKTTFKWIVRQLDWRYNYRINKNLGMVEIMSPSDYWKNNPPIYKDVYISVVENGIKFFRLTKELQYPVWREVNYHEPFEENAGNWFFKRLNHLL